MMKRFAVVLVFTVLAGCGLSDYESEMSKTLKKLQEKTRYDALWDPTPIDGIVGEGENEDVIEYPITIRLPKVFGSSDWFRPGSEYRNRRDEVDDMVLFPPFLGEFPGINRTGETYAEGEERNFLAYYCYLGVLDSRSAKFDAVLANVRTKTAAKLRNVTAWQDVECRDEHLVPTAWKMLEAKGIQTFANRSDQLRDMPGTFKMFAREDQGYMVFWAVRVPDEIAHNTSLVDIADAVAGTVKITAAAPTGDPGESPSESPEKGADAPFDGAGGREIGPQS